MKNKALMKTLIFRGFVLITSFVAPQLMFKDVGFSGFTFMLAVGLTGCYYIHEKIWEWIEKRGKKKEKKVIFLLERCKQCGYCELICPHQAIKVRRKPE